MLHERDLDVVNHEDASASGEAVASAGVVRRISEVRHMMSLVALLLSNERPYLDGADVRVDAGLPASKAF